MYESICVYMHVPNWNMACVSYRWTSKNRQITFQKHATLMVTIPPTHALFIPCCQVYAIYTYGINMPHICYMYIFIVKFSPKQCHCLTTPAQCHRKEALLQCEWRGCPQKQHKMSTLPQLHGWWRGTQVSQCSGIDILTCHLRHTVSDMPEWRHG